MARFKSISRLKRALMGKKHRKSDIINDRDEEKEQFVSECQNNSPIDVDCPDENRFFGPNTTFTINRPINSLLRSFRRKIDGRKKRKNVGSGIEPTIITSPLFVNQSTSQDDELIINKPAVKVTENLLDFSPDIDSEIPYADEGDSEEEEGDVVDSVPKTTALFNQAQPKHNQRHEVTIPKSSPPPPPISSYPSATYKHRHYQQQQNHYYYQQQKQQVNYLQLKSNFSSELVKLAKCGWYWGPISRSEADHRLKDAGDGSFLVRDSSDDHHLLSLSFRSNGRTYHTRIEHNNGLFSFTSQPLLPAAYPSVITLINESMKKSKAGVFCYSCGRSPNNQKVPVRLITPVFRFNTVPSLQFLCRFVIRLYNISKLSNSCVKWNNLEQSHYHLQ